MDRSLFFKRGHRRIGWLTSVAALGVGILGISAGSALAAPPLGETNSFVALQLKVTATEVTLVEAQQFPGKAKPDPQANGIDYVIRSQDGAVIARGSIENPRFGRSCTEAVPGSGTLSQATSVMAEGITVLRLGSDPDMGSIEFFETPRAGAQLSSAKKSLGKISLKNP